MEIKYKGLIISQKVRRADNFWRRLVGYMFSARPAGDDGIYFDPGRSIHTFFMRFNLDVVFLRKDGLVVKIFRNLKPWRMTWIYFQADHVLELPSGKLPLEVKEGEFLEVRACLN
jgi:uncharacterized protein